MRLRTGYLDVEADDLDEALGDHRAPAAARQPVSVGAARQRRRDLSRDLVRRGVRPDAVTDQTSAHDPVNGYLPKGWTLAEWEERREREPKAVEKAAKASMATHVRGDARFPPDGRADARLRQQHPPDGQGRGRRRRLRLPGLCAGLYPPALLPRHRSVPLGGAVGRSRRHLPHRRQGQGAAAATTRICTTGSTWRGRAHPLPGPARADLLGRPRRPTPARPGVQRDGRLGRAEGARS